MRPVDYVVVAVYLVGVFAVGFAARGRQRNVDDYFTAHGTFKGPIGSLIIGLSIAASFFSGISFIVYSSFAYSSGVKLLLGLLGIPISWVLLRFWFLDRYWAAKNRHPYDIVEARFGYGARACLSVMFVLYRLGWMAVIVYAPTLIIMGALGLGPAWFWPVVVAIGGTCTLLAVVGGIRGLIMTDAVQFLIIILGLALTMGVILVRMHWAAGAICSDLLATDHLRFVDFTLSFTAPWTFWAIFIGSTVSSASMYVSDQMALQRYLAGESRDSVSRSFVVNIFGALCVGTLLVAVGLLLSVWYLHHPDKGLPANPDQVLPYFAARQLPAGMSGLLIAAILAATTNTLTSGINSLAGSIISDFVLRLGPAKSPAELLRLARLVSIGLGVLATLSAGFASHLGSVLDSSNILQGAFAGSMLACMLWAASRLAVRRGAVIVGMIVGAAAAWEISTTRVSSFWVAPGGFALALLIPWLDAKLRPHS